MNCLRGFVAKACVAVAAVAAVSTIVPAETFAQDYYYGGPAYYAPAPAYYAPAPVYYGPPPVVYSAPVYAPAPVTVYPAPAVVEPYYVARRPLVSVNVGPAGVYVGRPWFRRRWEEKVYTPYGTHEYEYKVHRNGYVSVEHDFDD